MLTRAQYGWDWCVHLKALSKANPVAAARFSKIGQPMMFGKDIFLSNAGPV